MRSLGYFVGWRYLFSKKKKALLSLTTLISLGGVATGVMALIVVISVMNGFGKDLQSKVLGFKSHIVMESEDFLPFRWSDRDILRVQQADSRITQVTPYVQTEMMIRRRSSVSGILFKGVDLPMTRTEGDLSLIWMGRELGQALGVSEGDAVEVISPIETTGPLGTIPKMKKYLVAGQFETGLYEFDTKLVYVALSEAQRFLERDGKVDGIEIKVSDIHQTADILLKIKAIPAASRLLVRDWSVLNKNLFSALRLEKIAMFVILSFIILVAALNIVTSTTRVVLDKRREISILKAMGAKRGQILGIFLLQGLGIGLSGMLLGVLGGWGICVILNRFQWIHLPDIYYHTTVPVEIRAPQLIVIALIALGITGLCSLYPSWRASQLDPLDGIRY